MVSYFIAPCFFPFISCLAFPVYKIRLGMLNLQSWKLHEKTQPKSFTCSITAGYHCCSVCKIKVWFRDVDTGIYGLASPSVAAKMKENKRRREIILSLEHVPLKKKKRKKPDLGHNVWIHSWVFLKGWEEPGYPVTFTILAIKHSLLEGFLGTV